MVERLVENVDADGVRIGWKYHTRNGRIESYDPEGILQQISSPDAPTVYLQYDVLPLDGGDDNLFTLDRVHDNYGHSLIFQRDDRGRIQAITDQAGATWQYLYDDGWNLQYVIYPDNTSGVEGDNPVGEDNPYQTYKYEDALFPYALTGIYDETGSRYATFCYDEAGRGDLSEHGVSSVYGAAVEQDYAGYCANENGVRDNTPVAERFEFTYHADDRTTLTELIDQKALGTSTDDVIAERTYHYTTIHGVLKTTRVEGDPCAGCGGGQYSLIAYDANGFVSSREDFEGNVTLYRHNDRGLEACRIEGHGTAESRRTETEWHADFRMPTKETVYGLPPGQQGGEDCDVEVTGSSWIGAQETVFQYDGAGRLQGRTLAENP